MSEGAIGSVRKRLTLSERAEGWATETRLVVGIVQFPFNDQTLVTSLVGTRVHWREGDVDLGCHG